MAPGLHLHVRYWNAAAAPRATIVIAHGYAEHGGRYGPLAARLNAAGFSVAAPDHRGHGRSQGKRRSIRVFSEYVDDLSVVIDRIHTRHPALPVVLLGHSMGGLVALSYALRADAQLHALVLSAPAASAGGVSRATVVAGRMVARIAPDLELVRLPLDRISRDPAVVEAYMNDELVSPRRMRARMAAEIVGTMEVVQRELAQLALPLLVMQGDRDGLVDPGAGPLVYERAGSADKTLHVYPGLYHEIFNEPERDQVLDDVVEWLAVHVGATAESATA